MYKPLTPANVLLIIRNRTGNDWNSICNEFGINPTESDTLGYMLRGIIDRLRDAGLITYTDTDSCRPTVRC
jgi:hypothetical protein